MVTGFASGRALTIGGGTRAADLKFLSSSRADIPARLQPKTGAEGLILPRRVWPLIDLKFLNELAAGDAIEFGKLGYADAAIKSYEAFRRAQAAGKIDAGTRSR